MLRSLHPLASASRYSPMGKHWCASGSEALCLAHAAAWPSQCNIAASSAGCFIDKPVPSFASGLLAAGLAHCQAHSWLLHVLSLTWAAFLQVWPQLAVCTV